MSHSYKYYAGTLDVSDGPLIIDLQADLGTQRVEINFGCKEGLVKISFEKDGDTVFGDEGEHDACDGILTVDRVKRIKIEAVQDGSIYKIWAGL